jgi:hypothetical protein
MCERAVAFRVRQVPVCRCELLDLHLLRSQRLFFAFIMPLTAPPGEDSGVLHGHGTPFNKVFTYGMDEATAWAQTEMGWGGCFFELQIGVAPSQIHTFPLPAHTRHSHAEYVITTAFLV